MQKGRQLHLYRCRAMNTEIETMLENQPGQVKCELEQTVDRWFRAIERRFSRFLPESELSRLNSYSGKLTLVSAAMAEVLLLADMYRSQTEGLFTPFVYDALRAAGYDRSFEQLDKENASVTDVFADSEASMAIYPQMMAVQLTAGAHIDLGGIVKGWSAEKLAGRLRRRYGIRRGLVNAGGDVQAWGGSSTEEPWNIGIASPWDTDEELALVSLRDGAVATSSVCGRRWRYGPDGQGHHLIDPRTMKPAVSDVAQCSIVGDNLIPCEIWAKVVCIAGLDYGLALLQKYTARMEALIVTHAGDIHFYGNTEQIHSRWEIEKLDFVHTVTCVGKGERLL
ncbi:FAD:protein FMN transferase [Brevibacillus sp. GCM10020057]|uniref:FAD:protein FMN transferase n=1 Tax=Brevibacillus sp. GCM10020057 TaxID=3317327 RepID=UPI0036451734